MCKGLQLLFMEYPFLLFSMREKFSENSPDSLGRSRGKCGISLKRNSKKTYHDDHPRTLWGRYREPYSLKGDEKYTPPPLPSPLFIRSGGSATRQGRTAASPYLMTARDPRSRAQRYENARRHRAVDAEFILRPLSPPSHGLLL